MSQRLNYAAASPEAFKTMLALEKYLASAVELPLLHLVKLRASQINGCAYCIDMHWKDARAGGETEQRLYGLDAWRESPYYSDKERAALAWTEVITNIKHAHSSDAEFTALRQHFNDKQIADLSWAIAAINAWNRMGIGFQITPGAYKSQSH